MNGFVFRLFVRIWQRFRTDSTLPDPLSFVRRGSSPTTTDPTMHTNHYLPERDHLSAVQNRNGFALPYVIGLHARRNPFCPHLNPPSLLPSRSISHLHHIPDSGDLPSRSSRFSYPHCCLQPTLAGISSFDPQLPVSKDNALNLANLRSGVASGTSPRAPSLMPPN